MNQSPGRRRPLAIAGRGGEKCTQGELWRFAEDSCECDPCEETPSEHQSTQGLCGARNDAFYLWKASGVTEYQAEESTRKGVVSPLGNDQARLSVIGPSAFQITVSQSRAEDHLQGSKTIWHSVGRVHNVSHPVKNYQTRSKSITGSSPELAQGLELLDNNINKNS